jgi:hypothetical protein
LITFVGARIASAGKKPRDAFMVLSDSLDPMSWIDVSFEIPVALSGPARGV